MRKIMNVQQDIIMVIEEKLFRRICHLKRMGRDRIPKTILKCSATGKRKKGKLGEQRMYGVRRSMISKGFTEEDAEDRELWRSKISVGWRIPNVL